jgi:broad specificity phosphatase PhoE
MVRHGHAAASFTDDLDPGLNELGHSQAVCAGEQLIKCQPLHIVSSPLKRARETAVPLAQQLQTKVHIENRVAEVPSPGLSLQERGPWLQSVMQGKWADQSQALREWQRDMADCLLSLKQDTAIFTHFVAINAMVALAENASDVLVFRPDNGSITRFQSDGLQLNMLSRGSVAPTRVN